MNVADREKEGGHTPYLSTPKKIAKSNFLKAIPWRAQLRRAGRFLREVCHSVYTQPRCMSRLHVTVVDLWSVFS